MKTAEKGLQFGVSKCKYMKIAKNPDYVFKSLLEIDSWKVEYKDNLETGENELVEIYEGKVPIQKTDEQKYLWFIISSSGNNMPMYKSD